MAYRSLLIYFTSGSGNTYRACTWLAEEASLAGLATRLVPIEAGRPEVEVPAGPGALLGLAMPTHGFTAPWHMLRFILRLPSRPGLHTFIMPMRGMVKVGRLTIPGFEGSAGFLPALVMALKGYSVRGVRAVDTPSSWTVMHPAFSAQAVGEIESRGRAQAVGYLRTLLGGRLQLSPPLNLLFGLFLLPISLGYILIGRLFLAKLMFASERCNGCGVCAQDCPVGAIRMLGNPSRPYWGFPCEGCMRCRNFCPEQAVEASYSLGALLYFLTSVPLMGTLLGRRGRVPGRWFRSGLGGRILEYPWRLAAIYLAYWAFVLLNRIPAINRFFAVTTPSRYYRRYHARGTRARDLTREWSHRGAQRQ